MMVNLPSTWTTTRRRAPIRVVETMLPYFSENFGNANGVHVFSQRAESVDMACSGRLADHGGTREIIFTSGARRATTSPSRRAVMYRRQGNHIVTTQIEHRACSTSKSTRAMGFVTRPSR